MSEQSSGRRKDSSWVWRSFDFVRSSSIAVGSCGNCIFGFDSSSRSVQSPSDECCARAVSGAVFLRRKCSKVQKVRRMIFCWSSGGELYNAQPEPDLFSARSATA